MLTTSIGERKSEGGGGDGNTTFRTCEQTRTIQMEQYAALLFSSGGASHLITYA